MVQPTRQKRAFLTRIWIPIIPAQFPPRQELFLWTTSISMPTIILVFHSTAPPLSSVTVILRAEQLGMSRATEPAALKRAAMEFSDGTFSPALSDITIW